MISLPLAQITEGFTLAGGLELVLGVFAVSRFTQTFAAAISAVLCYPHRGYFGSFDLPATFLGNKVPWLGEQLSATPNRMSHQGYPS
jgi:hypothetical protein